GVKPDILYYAGVPAQKFLANSNPDADIEIIETAMQNIQKIEPKSVVLISTVDVYPASEGVDENTVINQDILEPYGKHRYILEQFVRYYYKDHTIIRLPGLFGVNIKKNFIYDMIHFLPGMITASKIAELDFSLLSNYYKPMDNGFYKLIDISAKDRLKLTTYFKQCDFSALSFTDSRSSFQFYNLNNLFDQIEVARSFGIRLLNLATQPCEAAELYKYIFEDEFINFLEAPPAHYDMRSIHANRFYGEHGYIRDKFSILKEIKDFVITSKKQLETR
ncbi:MAG: NAD-dependent epimerase/dehydratase family protein, partial [Oscillospiraceae bacterium]|nr:NAD-dependent epimerase/dehydratase family protein [Oscillospiraceae bacterium]